MQNRVARGARDLFYSVFGVHSRNSGVKSSPSNWGGGMGLQGKKKKKKKKMKKEGKKERKKERSSGDLCAVGPKGLFHRSGLQS